MPSLVLRCTEPRARNKERPPGAEAGAWLTPERKWGPRSHNHEELDSCNDRSGLGSIQSPRVSGREHSLANTLISTLGDLEPRNELSSTVPTEAER